MNPSELQGPNLPGEPEDIVKYSQAVERARTYYNSNEADAFYAAVWGGEDIHIGIYAHPEEEVARASRRTVEVMADGLVQRGAAPTIVDTVLDLGAGYGGSARYLATRFGCSVACLNLSEVQNERNRQLNRERNLVGRIRVIDGDFEQIPAEDDSYAIVWSQDALLHSGDRERAVREAVRVLRPGGVMVFTDIMQRDVVPPALLHPILKRIELASLGSVAFYGELLLSLGMVAFDFEDFTPELCHHYRRVSSLLEERLPKMDDPSSADYGTRMLEGLEHWIRGGETGALAWGLLFARKPPIEVGLDGRVGGA